MRQPAQCKSRLCCLSVAILASFGFEVQAAAQIEHPLWVLMAVGNQVMTVVTQRKYRAGAHRCFLEVQQRSLHLLVAGTLFSSTIEFAGNTGLESDLATQHVAVHREIANQAVERVAERGRTVFFKKEMPDPCESVTCNR